MGTPLLDHVLWDMGQAFDALFANLKGLADDDWLWLPEGGVRSVAAIAGHVASSKVMYENHAFGDAAFTWEDPAVHGEVALAAPGFCAGAVVDRLRESQRRLLGEVAALRDDAELLRERPVPWGRTMPTRWILRTLVQHDGFHAGEINHLRALHQRDDQWEWLR